MERRNIAQLATYEVKDEIESIPCAKLQYLYLKKTSEIIYITKNKKLYGIICPKEILNKTSSSSEIKINKTFTALVGYNIVKAYRIFATKGIKKIPVINANGELIGEYSKWDDLLFIERNQKRLINGEGCNKILKIYDNVYVVKPVKNKQLYFLLLKDCLSNSGIEYIVVDKEQIEEKLSENAYFIFVDEDERIGTECFMEIKLSPKNEWRYNICKTNKIKNISCFLKSTTYKNLLIQIMKENELYNLNMIIPDSISRKQVDDLAYVLFSDLMKEGVRCFRLFLENLEEIDKLSAYGTIFKEKMNERLKKYPVSIKEPWPKKNQNPDFYDELYLNDDYITEKAQKEIFEQSAVYDKSNVNGKYFNARDGRRITCFQPEKYIGKIYLFGRCTILGTFVEDQYTIASFLQKKLLEKGYYYQVENYGDVVNPYKLDLKLEEVGSFSKNDIVIYFPPNLSKQFVNIPEISLNKIFEKYQIPSTWITDSLAHGNHKVNNLVAEDILETVEPYLDKGNASNHEKVQFNIYQTMKKYIDYKYWNQYFLDCNWEVFDRVGAIAMDCDPYNKRHRYLIEQARQQVDVLIVFIMEEDNYRSCLFSFEQRFKMVAEGVMDLENIVIVPSGLFDLLGTNFPRNLIRTERRVSDYSKYYLNSFAVYVARPLGITHFFVESESEHEIVKMYNEVMKEVLPQKGISCIEIPMMPGGNDITTSQIQKYLRKGEYDCAFKMLTEPTKQYCMELAGLM